MTRYSPEFKEQMVRRMMSPQNQSVASIHREIGVSAPSPYAWKRQFQERGYVVPAKTSQPDGWDNKAKLAAVIATAPLNEAERSAWCREWGVYMEQLEAWKAAFEEGDEGGGSRASQAALATERRKRLAVEKELHRKEKALAEAAALLTLSKNAQAIWGTDAED